MHQFVGCSHLMSVRFFIHSINDCFYQATYCKSIKEFKANSCFKVNNTVNQSTRMGYYANLSSKYFKNSNGNFFLTTSGHAPYCKPTDEKINSTTSTKKNFFGNLISKIG